MLALRCAADLAPYVPTVTARALQLIKYDPVSWAPIIGNLHQNYVELDDDEDVDMDEDGDDDDEDEFDDDA